jgi:pimeloyl-ACP methyl ester carboxylesterase
MKRSLLVFAVLWFLTFISMVPVSALAMIIIPVPLTDSFDRFNSLGWRVFYTADGSVDPNHTLFRFDDGGTGNCHDGGCVHSDGESNMIFYTTKNLDAGSFSVWAKLGTQVTPTESYIELCDYFCNQTLRFDTPFLMDGKWHQYYFVWSRSGGTANWCVLRDSLNSGRCVWQSTTIAGSDIFTDSLSGLRLYGSTPDNDIYFDDLEDSPQPQEDTACSSDCYSNVMFLPGIEGSRLYETEGGMENKIWEPGSDSDALRLQMDTSGTSLHDVYTKEGDVLDEVCVFHICPNIYKSFMDDMDSLKADGTITDWAPIAYDWRLSFDELLDGGVQDGNKITYSASTENPYIITKLKELADSSKTGKVTIVAHSNGGLLAKALIMRLGPDAAQYVDKIIFVATPQLGTPDAIASVLHGTAGIPFILSNQTARQVAQNIPDVYNLLPSYNYFTYVDDPVVSFDAATLPDWVSAYGDVVHSTERLKKYMTDSTRPVPTVSDLKTPSVANATLFDDAVVAHQLLDNWTAPEGIEVYEIAGWGNDTLAGIRYKKVVTNTCLRYELGMCALYGKGSELTFDPQETIDGDGTVVTPSALWSNGASTTQYWVDLSGNGLNSKSERTKTGEVLPFAHTNLLEIASVKSLINNILEGKPVSLPQYVSDIEPSSVHKNRLHFVLHSPLTLGFVDSEGNYTGSTATTTLFGNPDIHYRRYGDVQSLSVPADERGSLVMKGVASGSFSLDIIQSMGDTALSKTSFEGVPSATSTVASLALDDGSPTASSTLLVDFDGNGSIDTSLRAQEGGVVLPDLVSPEAILSGDLVAHDLSISGIDDTSSTTIVRSATTTTITDAAGNKTTLAFSKTYSSKLLTYAKVLSVRYGSAAPTQLPTSFTYLWDSKQTLVSQTVIADNQFAIQALYDKTKNKTSIVVLQKNVPIKAQTVSGLAVIKLKTNKGQISFEW